MLRYRPHHVKRPFTRPRRLIMQRSVARIMPAILSPSQAPLAKACRALAALCSSSSGMTQRPDVSVSSVSGYRSLLIARLAGMLIMQEDIKACPLTPK